MPYIMKHVRGAFDKHLKAIGPHTTDPGDLNYCITVLVHEYLKAHGKSYAVMNDCMGVLEAAKLEFYRRIVAPYEDEKIKENGDIQILRAQGEKDGNKS
jgi:hypothetical protein